MKKSYKLMVSLLVVFTIITNLFLNSLTVSAETMLNYNIDNKVIAYAKDNYKEIAETFFNATVLEDLTDMAYNNYSVSELKLGKGFIVYNLQCEVQDEIYYFPIIYDDKIILLLSVIGTTDGYVLSATTNWVDELNSVGVNSGDVFFTDKQSLVSYNRSNKAEIICGIKSSTINKMSKLSYHEKVKLVNKRKNVMKKKECSYNGKGVNLKDKYTPDFSSNTSSSVSCALYNKQTQGDYGLCWAASIATIYNYRNGTDLTAKQVADRAGIGYDDGATVSEAYSVMFGYGLGYTNLMYYNIMPWNVVKTNINTKKPIYVSAKAGKNDEEGHAITIYGYSNVAGKNYVLFWNSGNGSVTSMEYKTTGGVFTYANETFVWRSSISAV